VIGRIEHLLLDMDVLFSSQEAGTGLMWKVRIILMSVGFPLQDGLLMMRRKTPGKASGWTFTESPIRLTDVPAPMWQPDSTNRLTKMPV
jgi:hypothetical protein